MDAIDRSRITDDDRELLSAVGPAKAIAAGEAPTELSEAWSGPYRYGVAGSLVAWIDDHWGRETVREALAFSSWPEFEARLGMTEPEFLAGWESWVTGD